VIPLEHVTLGIGIVAKVNYTHLIVLYVEKSIEYENAKEHWMLHFWGMCLK
jgi:hypothetical protein